MKKLRLSIVAASVAIMLAAVSPAGAITYGELDAGEHPYVGFMIFYDASEPGWFSCTGTLLDADTFLTAGHCAFGIGTDFANLGTSGGTDVWVTFDGTEVLAGWPLRAEIGTVYPTVEAFNAARRAWLESQGFIHGTAFPHPRFGETVHQENFDVGVVELNTGVSMPNYAELAPIGTAEILVEASKNKNDALIESVGYGIQAVQPHPLDVETRYKSTSRIVGLNSSVSRAGNLHTLNNPSEMGGQGGSCFGDSGGPLFVNNTDDVVAVVSWGPSLTCHGADYSWRVDTQDSYDFIVPFLSI